MKKRILTLALALALSVGLAAPAAASTQFSDAPSTHWAYQEITEAVSRGITNGYSDGTFKPGSSVTNAHFAAFLARAFYSGEYDDTGASPWYKPYTDTLENHGILKGTTVGDDLSGNIDKAINRYDMARMMYNVLLDKGARMPTSSELKAAKNAIDDFLSVPAYYKDAVAACYAMGVLNGQSDGTFGGNNLMNRAQGCVVVYRLTQKIENGSTGIETPTQPEEPEKPTEPNTSSGNGFLTNGKPITEENVLERLEEIKKEYPDGTLFQPVGTGYSSKAIPGGYLHDGCNGWAAMCSDLIFGKGAVNMPRVQEDSEYVRPGDIIKYLDENGKVTHYTIATSGIKNGYKGAKSFDISTASVGSNIVEWVDCSTMTSPLNTLKNMESLGLGWVIYTRYPD